MDSRRLVTGNAGMPGAGNITPAQLPGLALWLIASAGILFGGMYHTPVQNAGLTAAVAFTGTPTFGVTKSFEITIDGAGAVGVATFKWFHNGVLQASGVLTAASVALTDGVSVTFPVHVYSVNDDWTDVPSVESWTSQDASATVFSQATAALQPAWIAAGLVLTGWTAGPNGKASVLGNGTTDYLSGPLAVAQPNSGWILGQGVTLPGSNSVMLSSDSGTPYINATSPLESQVSGGTAAELLSPVAVLDSPFLVTWALDGALSQFPLGYSIGNLGASAWSNPSTLFSYLAGGPRFWWSGYISEVVLAHGIASIATRAGMSSYFASSYAVVA